MIPRDPTLARLAHDLANVLTAAMGRLSVLANREPEPSAELRGAVDAITRAREVLHGILEHARGDVSAPFSLAEAWQSAVAPLEREGVACMFTSPADAPEVFADRRQIDEIFSSIVGTERAAKVRAGLESRLEHEGDRLALVVRSDAPPFSEEELARLRDPFFLRKPEGLGEGINFAVGEKIAARNGGAFVAAVVGGAREYRLTLPARPRGDGGTATPGSTPGAGEPGSRKTSTTPSRSCLVVDDDPSVRQSCGLMLRHLGFRWEGAASGETALERLERESFDVVILDLHLGPPLDGEDLVERLRSRRPEVLRHTILATGDPAAGSVTRLTRELGLGVLAKPFGVEDLRTAIARIP